MPSHPRRVETLYSVLMAEPLLLRPWEIARLTDRQIIDLYLRERDEQGKLKIEPEVISDVDADAQFLAMCAALGIPEAKRDEVRRRANERREQAER